MGMGNTISTITRRWQIQRYDRQQLTTTLRDERSLLRARLADEGYYGIPAAAA